jgi:hypothetical protein
MMISRQYLSPGLPCVFPTRRALGADTLSLRSNVRKLCQKFFFAEVSFLVVAGQARCDQVAWDILASFGSWYAMIKGCRLLGLSGRLDDVNFLAAVEALPPLQIAEALHRVSFLSCGHQPCTLLTAKS